MSDPSSSGSSSSPSSSSDPRSTSPPLPPSDPPPSNYVPPHSTASSIRPPSLSHAAHPLLSPLMGTPSADALRSLGAKIGVPTSSLSTSSASSLRQPVPEKCLSFCSQRNDAPPLCRMLCLRRRNPVQSKEEALRRLRPQRLSQSATIVYSSDVASTSTSNSTLASGESVSKWWDVHPFESLRRKVEPYSIIYVRGTADGVVGRYMEELEYDDGVYDFGDLSRGAEESARRRRKESQGIQYLDWGDGGALLHLPLSSLFHPILSIPKTINTLTTPSFNLLSQYRTSWSDGTQSKAWTKFSTDVENGGAFTMLWKARSFWAEKVKAREEELRKLREARREAQAGERREGVEGGKGQ